MITLNTIQEFIFYLMRVWEHEKQQFLHNIFGIDCKEILQLVHRHESVNLQNRLQGGEKKKSIKTISFIRTHASLISPIGSVGFNPLTYHCISLKLASHLFVHNILALVGKR